MYIYVYERYWMAELSWMGRDEERWDGIKGVNFRFWVHFVQTTEKVSEYQASANRLIGPIPTRTHMDLGLIHQRHTMTRYHSFRWNSSSKLKTQPIWLRTGTLDLSRINTAAGGITTLIRIWHLPYRPSHSSLSKSTTDRTVPLPGRKL